MHGPVLFFKYLHEPFSIRPMKKLRILSAWLLALLDFLVRSLLCEDSHIAGGNCQTARCAHGRSGRHLYHSPVNPSAFHRYPRVLTSKQFNHLSSQRLLLSDCFDVREERPQLGILFEKSGQALRVVTQRLDSVQWDEHLWFPFGVHDSLLGLCGGLKYVSARFQE